MSGSVAKFRETLKVECHGTDGLGTGGGGRIGEDLVGWKQSAERGERRWRVLLPLEDAVGRVQYSKV